MTFVRIKTIKGKQYKYLVRNKWENGTVRQVVVKYIGPVNPIYKLSKTRKSNAWLFVDKISDQERNFLLKSLDSKSQFTKDRARIVLLSSKGMSCKQISEKLSFDQRKVRTCIKSFNANRIESLKRGKPMGALPKFTKEQKIKILELVSTDPRKLNLPFTTWSLSKIKKYLIDNRIVSCISSETIRKYLKESGMKVKKSRRFQYSDDPEFLKKN